MYCMLTQRSRAPGFGGDYHHQHWAELVGGPWRPAATPQFSRRRAELLPPQQLHVPLSNLPEEHNCNRGERRVIPLRAGGAGVPICRRILLHPTP